MAVDKTRAPAFATPVYLVGSGGTFPPTGLDFKGSQQLALSGVPQALTVPAGATQAYVQAEGGNARWGTAGVNPPTGDVGPILWGTASMTVAGSLLPLMEFINMTGSTATLDIAYFG